MSTNDYVKFVTQQIVSYIDKPKEVRKQTRQKRKQEKSPMLDRWFGVIPFAFMLWYKKKKN
ncbi:YqzE family protein [Bacillus timonensis]|nr:YqzE family protein [Bacillus timonensis]